jgi:hypothetical protein
MKNEKVTLPCENCICLPICRDIYNDFLLAYIEELSRKQLSSFKVAAKAKARIKLANRCSIFDNYLYDPKIDGIENLNRETTHHLYFIRGNETLRSQYPCQRKTTKTDSHVEDV